MVCHIISKYTHTPVPTCFFLSHFIFTEVHLFCPAAAVFCKWIRYKKGEKGVYIMVMLCTKSNYCFGGGGEERDDDNDDDG